MNRFQFTDCHFNIKDIKIPYVVKMCLTFKPEINLKYCPFIPLSAATDKWGEKVTVSLVSLMFNVYQFFY